MACKFGYDSLAYAGLRLWCGLVMALLAGYASAVTATAAASSTSTTTVVYPRFESKSEVRFNDLLEILDMALQKTTPQFGAYILTQSSLPMNEARYMVELARPGSGVNVAWSSTSVAKETEFLPIRIPLRKGLLGYRIALIASEKQALVDQAKTLDDLKKLTIGQGIGWGDVALYQANGFTVFPKQYSDLFPLTALGQFDLFPRGIGEVFDEFALNKQKNPNLAIEKNLLIYYPWPYYFFFNKNDAALKTRVETGLRMMIKDGSFNALFKKHHQSAIDNANFKGRRVIRIQNHLLPPETPLSDASLWFDPSR